MTRLLSAALVIVLSVAAGAAGVARANGLDTVAEELRQDFVYVDPDAERALSTQEADEVRDAIREADTPIYIAVLPESAADVAGGDPAEVARQLSQAVGRPGTYGVVVGDSFRAGSSELPSGEAGQLATDALDSGGDDTTSVLVEFAGLVGGAVAADESGSGGSESGDGDGGSGTSIWLPILLVVGAAAIGYWVWRNSKRRQAQAEEQARAEAADRQLLQAELSVLADDVVRLEPEVELHPAAQSDYNAAVSRYRAAQAALEYADEPVDLVRVQRVVAEANYSMDRVRAIVQGREPPSPPTDLQSVGPHGEPAVTLDDDRQPSYVGYPGGYQGGWFGGTGGGLFSGLLLGSLLAGGFGGWGYGGHTTIINEGGDGGDGGGDWSGGWRWRLRWWRLRWRRLRWWRRLRRWRRLLGRFLRFVELDERDPAARLEHADSHLGQAVDAVLAGRLVHLVERHPLGGQRAFDRLTVLDDDERDAVDNPADPAPAPSDVRQDRDPERERRSWPATEPVSE